MNTMDLLSLSKCFMLLPMRNGRRLSFWMTAVQVNDYLGAAALLDDLPKTSWLLGDRGYDGDWFRDGLQTEGIQPCIPDSKSLLTQSLTKTGAKGAAASRSCLAI